MQLSKLIKILFFSWLAAAASIYVIAEDIILPEEEAAPVLYSGAIGDADVDLFMFGSWNLNTSYGFSLPIGGLNPLTPYRITPGFYFQQIPDLTISLWLLNRYFIETSFYPGGYENNTYVMGMMGEDDDLIKVIRVGNKGISMPSNPYISIPDGSSNGFGAYTHFGTENWDNHILLRYDSFTRESVEYRGTSERQTARIPVEDYIRGVSFLLPDNSITNAEVYIQDSSGSFIGNDGERYSVLSSDSYTLQADTGYLEFTQPLTRKTLISYSTSFGPVGSSGGGIGGLNGTDANSLDSSQPPADFNWNLEYLGLPLSQYRVDITDGGTQYTALLIWENGIFSPFENASLYDTAVQNDSAHISAVLTPPDDVSESIPISLEVQNSRLSIVPSTGIAKRNLRYPLTDIIASYYTGESGSYSGWEIVTEQLLPQKAIPAPADAIPGSISVFVNGIETPQFSIENGSITFPFPIRSSDTVRVMYSREGGESNTLMQTSYHQVNINENLHFYGASAYMWTLPNDSVSQYYGQYPGFFLGSVGADYSNDYLNLSVQYSGSIGTEDSTGRLQLSGLEENAYTISPAGKILAPAAADNGIFTAETRVFPQFKDYRIQADTGLTFYQDAGWAIPQANISANNEGSQIGPYIVKGNSLGYSTLFAVAEAELAQNQWTGFTLALDSAENIPDSISFIAGFQGAGEVTLYTRIGAISEDIDGDNQLDSEQTEAAAGFRVDSGSGYYLYGGGIVTQGNGYKDTEDLNGDEYLSGETSQLVIETEIEDLSEGTGLKELTLTFTDSQKALLKELRGIQFVIQPASIDGADGRLLVGDVHLQQQGARTNSETGSLIYNEDAETLQYAWNTETSGHSITVPFTPFPRNGYSKISCTYSLPVYDSVIENGWAEATLILKTGRETGFSAPIQLTADSDTHEIEIDMDDMTVSVNSNKTTLQPLSAGSGGRSAQITAMKINFPPNNGGRLVLSKPVASDPDESIQHGGKLKAAIKVPEIVPWLKTDLNTTITAATGNVAEALMPEYGYRHINFLQEEHIVVPRTDINLFQRAGYTDYDEAFAFGHSLGISPFRGIRCEDSFSFSPQDETATVETGNKMSLSYSYINLRLQADSSYSDTEYMNTWEGAMEIPFLRNLKLNINEQIQFKITDQAEIDDYASAWSASKYNLYRNDSGNAFYRENEFSSRLLWDYSEESSIQTGFGTTALKHYDPVPLHEDMIRWDIGWRSRLGPGLLDISLGHEAVSSTSWELDGDVFSDMSYLFNSIPKYRPVYFPVPGYHLYPYVYSDELTNIDTNIDITSTGNIGYTRPTASVIFDLIVPFRSEYRTQRTLKAENESLSDEYLHTGVIKWETRNAFGRLGRYPLWSFYDVEEYTASLSISASGNLDEYSIDHRLSLLLYTKGIPRWEFNHDLLAKWKEFRENDSLQYMWNSAVGPVKLYYDFLTSDTLKHTEETGTSFGLRDNEILWNIYIQHSSDLLFDPWGSLGAYIEIDYLQKTMEDTVNAGIGFELGIKGELTF